MSKSNTTNTLYGNINDTNSLSDDNDDDSSDLKFKHKSQDIQIKK